MAPKPQQGGRGSSSGAGTSQQAGGGGGKPPSGGAAAAPPKPAGGLNYFAALSGFTDGAAADSLHDELTEQEEQRRAAAAAASSSNGAAAKGSGGACGGGGGNGRGGGLKQPLVWIDLEMTGLDPDKDSIMQIAVIVTDGTLDTAIEGPELDIHQSEEQLAGMNEWCVEQHGKSGLTQACRDSSVSLAEAEQTVLEFVQRHVPDPGQAQIAGNSVHVDLAFLRKWMPRLVDHLHYRIVDVSTIGELCRRWFPRDSMRAPKKKNTHTALSDIQESIAQLAYYRKAIFKK